MPAFYTLLSPSTMIKEATEMTTLSFEAQYVTDAAGRQTHVIVPIEFWESLLHQRQQSQESVFVNIEEAEQWLQEELPEDVDFKQDSISQMKLHKTHAPEDLSERLDDYLYGKRK